MAPGHSEAFPRAMFEMHLKKGSEIASWQINVDKS